jgi:ATP-dependent Clp protease ATP-binding subunit ClpC
LLQNLGVDLDGLSARVLGILQRGSASATPLAQRPYTTRTKRVFELAAQASESLGHHYVGTEHVLLGLLEEAHGIGGQVLTSSGVTIERARAEALRLLGTTPS